MSLPRVLILGVGGTIASSAPVRTQTTGYTLSATAASLIADLPELVKIAELRAEQVSNLTSQEVNTAALLALAKSANAALQGEGCDGVVVIHGTDTMEETAYFLNLTVRSRKPVVVVGSMRPASALSSDGPRNLYDAVQVAAHAGSAGRGVLVVANGVISAARWVTKSSTTGMDAFTSGRAQIGHVAEHRIVFDKSVLCRHTSESEFDVSDRDNLPVVDIVYAHQDIRLDLFRASIEGCAQGLVFAATGNGTLSEVAKQAIVLARERGVVFVRASRVASGPVTPKQVDAGMGIVSAGTLSPQKARIALRLALTLSRENARIQEILDAY